MLVQHFLGFMLALLMPFTPTEAVAVVYLVYILVLCCHIQNVVQWGKTSSPDNECSRLASSHGTVSGCVDAVLRSRLAEPLLDYPSKCTGTCAG